MFSLGWFGTTDENGPQDNLDFHRITFGPKCLPVAWRCQVTDEDGPQDNLWLQSATASRPSERSSVCTFVGTSFVQAALQY